MVKEKGFREANVTHAIEKIKKARQGGHQTSLQSFFYTVPKTKKTKAPEEPAKKTTKKKEIKKECISKNSRIE